MNHTLVLQNFFEYIICLKMYHFQSKTYGEHKTSDQIFSSLNAKFDELMEVYQGMYNERVDVKKNTKVFINNIRTKKEIMKLNKDFVNFLMDLKHDTPEFITSHAIIDEIILLVHRFEYLLSFE